VRRRVLAQGLCLPRTVRGVGPCVWSAIGRHRDPFANLYSSLLGGQSHSRAGRRFPVSRRASFSYCRRWNATATGDAGPFWPPLLFNTCCCLSPTRWSGTEFLPSNDCSPSAPGAATSSVRDDERRTNWPESKLSHTHPLFPSAAKLSISRTASAAQSPVCTDCHSSLRRRLSTLQKSQLSPASVSDCPRETKAKMQQAARPHRQTVHSSACRPPRSEKRRQCSNTPRSRSSRLSESSSVRGTNR
jgi:hypothetical protein